MSSKDRPFADPTPDRPARAETPEPPAAPPVVEYPKMLYHPDGRVITVQNKDEEAAAAKDGFTDTPGAPAETPDAPRDTRR